MGGTLVTKEWQVVYGWHTCDQGVAGCLSMLGNDEMCL